MADLISILNAAYLSMIVPTKGATTFIITAFSIMGLFETLNVTVLNAVILNVVMLSVDYFLFC